MFSGFFPQSVSLKGSEYCKSEHLITLCPLYKNVIYMCVNVANFNFTDVQYLDLVLKLNIFKTRADKEKLCSLEGRYDLDFFSA